MKIIDWYILKRFLSTFLFTLLILLPISVAIDFAEKAAKFLKNSELTTHEIVFDYYLNFMVYFGNTFMPLALFLAVIIFTSRMANNTEIIAINDAQVSFVRFLFPYFVGATMVTVFAFFMNHFFVPIANKNKSGFELKYIAKQKNRDIVSDFNLQLSDSLYFHIKEFNLAENTGSKFSLDTYNGLELKAKFIADKVNWDPEKKIFTLTDWSNRIVGEQDILSTGTSIDTTFAFTPKDFDYQEVTAHEMTTIVLNNFIDLSRKRGIKKLNPYLVELYKRTSLPTASLFLTMIAVCLSYKKRRGGMGLNLAIGVALMFSYVFCLKISEVLGAVPEVNPLFYVWGPNILFGTIALFLFLKARA